MIEVHPNESLRVKRSVSRRRRGDTSKAAPERESERRSFSLDRAQRQIEILRRRQNAQSRRTDNPSAIYSVREKNEGRRGGGGRSRAGEYLSFNFSERRSGFIMCEWSYNVFKVSGGSWLGLSIYFPREINIYIYVYIRVRDGARQILRNDKYYGCARCAQH